MTMAFCELRPWASMGGVCRSFEAANLTRTMRSSSTGWQSSVGHDTSSTAPNVYDLGRNGGGGGPRMHACICVCVRVVKRVHVCVCEQGEGCSGKGRRLLIQRRAAHEAGRVKG